MEDGASKPKVLIVDDEYLIAHTLALILNKSGFRALSLHHAWTAVQVAEGFQPDILLTDVMMPETDGFDLAVRISSIVPHCRVFLLSAQFRAATRVHEFHKKGYQFEFLHKPIPPADLIARLSTTRVATTTQRSQ